MRDKDANTAWDAASDATLEERRYYVQNWRADVVALLESDGDLSEWIRYSAYGEATVYPFVNGDYDADGDVDGDDLTAFTADYGSLAAAADVNRSGTVTSADATAFNAAWDDNLASTAWTAGGGLPANAGRLSVTSGNRIGYAGYQFDPATEQYHVRHRVYVPEMGRWTRRDPLGYVDGMGLVEYVRSQPINEADLVGLRASSRRAGLGGDQVVVPAFAKGPPTGPIAACDPAGEVLCTRRGSVYICYPQYPDRLSPLPDCPRGPPVELPAPEMPTQESGPRGGRRTGSLISTGTAIIAVEGMRTRSLSRAAAVLG